MNSLESGQNPVEPDAVLDQHMRAVSSAYRAKLAEAYADPQGAHAIFRAEANRLGPAEAAMLMRDEPGRFGALKDGGAGAAGEAALLGARAYHARIAQGDGRLGAEVLDGACAEMIARTGADPDRVLETWDVLRSAYGIEGASAVFTRRATEVFGRSVDAAVTEQVPEFAAARDHLRIRAGLMEEPAESVAAPLPRSLADERSAPAQLPEALQDRLVAASDGFRRRLAAGYENPLAAEARLHARVNRDHLAAIDAVASNPSVLGPLRTDHPGGVAAAEAGAHSALAYARIAYVYHHARFPEAAAEVAARDEVQSVRRTARDTDRAMEGVQEAIQLHGPELAEHLAQHREQSPGRDPERGGPSQNGGPGGPAGDGPGRSAAGGPIAASEADPAVDEAVRAHATLEEARDLTERTRQLREERAKAERKLAQLDEQDLALKRTERDFRAVAEVVYRDPGAAVEKWEKLVLSERGHLERARERLLEEPTLLGPLKTERHPGRRGRLGIRTIQPARDALPRLATRATAFTQAQRAVNDPVEWTTPEGETVRGREKVREAARTVVGDRQEQISAAEGRLKDVGGVRGSEQAAQRAFGRLSSEQGSRAAARMGSGGAARAASLMSTARQVMEVARAARTLSEGPAGL